MGVLEIVREIYPYYLVRNRFEEERAFLEYEFLFSKH